MTSPPMCCVRSVMKPLFSAAILAVVGARAIPPAATATQADFVTVSSQPANAVVKGLTVR
jgi:hypothetical protein